MPRQANLDDEEGLSLSSRLSQPSFDEDAAPIPRGSALPEHVPRATAPPNGNKDDLTSGLDIPPRPSDAFETQDSYSHSFIINEVAVGCVKEVSPRANHSESDKTKPLERTQREPMDILKRNGEGMNPFIGSFFSGVNVNTMTRLGWWYKIGRSSKRLVPD